MAPKEKEDPGTESLQAAGVDVLRAERTTAKRNFSRKVTLLEKAIAEKKAATLVEKLWLETTQFFEEVQRKDDAYIKDMLLQGKEVEENYMDEVEIKREDILLKYEEWKGEINKDNPKEGLANFNAKFKEFKVPPPRFNGSIREFLSWSKHFKRLVLPQCGEDPFFY